MLDFQKFNMKVFLNGPDMYTFLQKKCTLISSSSPGDPGSLTLTPGHFDKIKRPEVRVNLSHSLPLSLGLL